MVKRPWFITLIVYTRFLHAAASVCYTDYDIQMTCHDCCYGTPLRTYNNIKSDITCSELCSRDKRCRSLQYDPSKKECWTNGEKMETVNTSCSNLIQYGEIQLGSCHTSRMFESCTSDADCVIANSTCRSGTCECKDGHPYDYRSDSCPTGCTKYGNSFTEVSYYIPYTNDASYYGISVNECIQKCLTATEYVCRFVEYEMGPQYCSLSESNALTANGYPPQYSSWKMWDRNCA